MSAAQVVSTRKMLNLLLVPSCMTKAKVEYYVVVIRYKSELIDRLKLQFLGRRKLLIFMFHFIAKLRGNYVGVDTRILKIGCILSCEITREKTIQNVLFFVSTLY